MKGAALVTALLALLIAPAAHADGDPASDLLFGDNVFLSLVSPQTSVKGQELERLTAAAAKQGLIVKVAVIKSPTDLGAIPQLYGRASEYARFLRQELGWGSFRGTLIVVMNGSPGGVAVAGPAAAVARGRVSRLAIPPNATLDQLAGAAIRAVHGVAAAKQITLPPPPAPSNTRTRDRLIIGACLLAFIALALLASRMIRRRRG